MKYMKLIKRIYALFIVACIIFTTVFFSYNNTMIVNATEYSDLIFDAVCVTAASVGLVFSAPTAATVVATITPLLTQEGVDIYHYVTDNGDGTTTISEDFSLLVLEAYKQYREEHYFDGTYEHDLTNGYYKYEPSTFHVLSSKGSTYTLRISSFTSYIKFAYYLQKGGAIATNVAINPYVFMNGKVVSYSTVSNKAHFGIQPVFEIENNGFGGSTSGILPHFSINDGTYASFQPDCPSIPIFEDKAAMDAYLKGTGDASAAINYRNTSQFESSSYTGNYPGGDITVQTEKLGNIEDKLDEINETDKSIDDKLKDLFDWLGIGDGSGSGSGGIGAPSGWYEAVLDYLESILQALEALVWIEADDSISEDQKDLFDLIDKIWQDPENGSQEAADALSGSFSDVARDLTKKFPFSIPWDIHALFTVFANAGNSELALVSYSVEPTVMSYSAEPAVLYSDSGGIQTYAGDSGIITQEDHNAPYFVLPLVIESWGINEQVEIDLKDFQTLSTLSRTLFSLLFAVFLIKFTISVIKIYKGGSGD